MTTDEWTMRDTCSYDWQTADFPHLEATAEKYGYYVWKTIHRLHENGLNYLIILGYEPHSEYFESIPLGSYREPDTAVSDAINLLEVYQVNLHENHKLFPNIRGVMLKDCAMKLTLSKHVEITEMQNGDARVELAFIDHQKTAVVNRTQAQNIINMYGPETDNWQGKEVILYGEKGKWFGKHQWGIRVWDMTSPDDVPATVRAAMRTKAGQGGNGRKPATSKPIQYRYEVGADVMVPGKNDEKPGEVVELTADSNGKPLYGVKVDGRVFKLTEDKFKPMPQGDLSGLSVEEINSQLLPEQPALITADAPNGYNE